MASGHADWYAKIPGCRVVAGLDIDRHRVVHVGAHYLQGWLGSKHRGDWRERPGLLWRLSKSHGSLGVLGDLGVHIVDFATHPAGPVAIVQCKLKTFSRIKGKVLDACFESDGTGKAVTV